MKVLAERPVRTFLVLGGIGLLTAPFECNRKVATIRTDVEDGSMARDERQGKGKPWAQMVRIHDQRKSLRRRERDGWRSFFSAFASI